MAGTETLALFVLIPSATSAAAWVVLWRSAEAIRNGLPVEAPAPSRGRVVTAGAVATAPVVLGILLWWISQPYPESLEGARGLFAPMEVDLFFTATIAFAWAAVSATLSSTLIFRARMRSVLGADFGRVLPLTVVPSRAWSLR